MKERFFKRVSQENEETSPNQTIKLTKINIKINTFVRYSGLLLKWTREELQQMDQRTRPYILEMRDRIYVFKKEWRSGLAGIEDSIDTSIRHHEDNIKRKANYSDQKQHKQHSDQQDNHLKNRNKKKSNYMDISSEKQAKSHTRRFAHG